MVDTTRKGGIMKYIINLILFVTLLTPIVNADVYIVTKKATGEVVSVSNENDCVVQDNMKLTIDKTKDLSDVVLVSKPSMYKYTNGKFTANMTKISAQEDADLVAYRKDRELKRIERRVRKLAKDSLIVDGVTFDYDHDTE